MAVVSASGTYLPRGLTFGPTNGPEDFQACVTRMFNRRLGRDWYLFIDDATIATGKRRPKSVKEAHLKEDVSRCKQKAPEAVHMFRHEHFRHLF